MKWSEIRSNFGIENPLDPDERVIVRGRIGAERWGVIDCCDRPDGEWHVLMLRSITRGGGRAVLQTLCRRADTHGVPISLVAIPEESPGGIKMDRDRLIRWYETFGFVHLGDGKMRREPQR